MEIDHVFLTARTRVDAEQVVAEAGLGIARGRVIPGFGVSNLIVPLGQSLLEIHYPNGEEPDPNLPPIAEIQRQILEERDEPLVPLTWVMGFENESELRKQSAYNEIPVVQAPDDGPGFPPYLLAGFGYTLTRRWLPLFIHWQVPPPQRPSALPAPHIRQPTGIVGLELSGPVEKIEDWCGQLPPQVSCFEGTQGVLRVHIGFTDAPTITL